MCGIAGWFGRGVEQSGTAEKLAAALRHRGPDANGIRSWPDATLIHTRLSIIDLSPAGAQPMSNEDGTVWTVFNGEISNHNELRTGLRARGHQFRGRSDTEVLTHLYEEEGAKFVSRLRGMFTLAIYDLKQRKFLLARDRFGIKPLFFAANPAQLSFASEIQALRHLPEIDFSLDPQALSDFVALTFVPAPATFYKGIRALEPGQVLEAELAGTEMKWRINRFHQWTVAPNRDRTFAEASEQAEALINRAVQQQMESDVPVGCLLSGGIDSSLVSSAAQIGRKDPVRTFNVRFADAGYDETWAAVEVARHIGSAHQTLEMPTQGGNWKSITDLLARAGQPYADTSLFAAHAVCRLMRQHVTVALSGDGGDEGFGGYERFRRISPLRLWGQLPAGLAHGIAGILGLGAKAGLLNARIPEHLSSLAGSDNVALLEHLLCWVRPREHQELLAFRPELPTRRLFEPQWKYEAPKGASAIERLSAHTTEMGVRLVLASDFLFKVDVASMTESLEVRVPLLDEELFDFALTLPHAHKVEGKFCKRVLRAVADRRLPASVARKPKQGFMIPVDTWVDTSFKQSLRETLLGTRSGLRDLFNMELCRKMIEAFCSNQPCSGISREGLYQRMILLLSVHVAVSQK